MVKAFLSYSHQDQHYRDELETRLAMLKREGLVELWHDQRIGAGEPIDTTIAQQLESAELVLLLVSHHFLASDYCYEREMKNALERHSSGIARVVPIILSPCDWLHSPLASLRATPPDGRPITKFPDINEAFQLVVDDIRRAATELSPLAAGGGPTRPGPEPVITVVSKPRSSNLRVRREFTEKERDEFLEESFEYVANFFEESLSELDRRNPGVEGRYRREDKAHFSAAVYRAGAKESSCRIWIADDQPTGLRYAEGQHFTDRSYNECIEVRADGQLLALEPTMGPILSAQPQKRLSQQGAAEYLWGRFIAPLQ